ncbi:uncharacterized protein LOC118225905 [Anguilla anguilla]|uniref:uncharacterized protein LOC118225905 n=1 Tax=Anguilla anguilla TaxID=7936 RepID=UPI0015B12950|nr:uncharacterized protein LOC118225905 [Anguilla anguilla]XP_035270881.1 uncharacterized protein LOC118225905 [Anguilla anguilla]
MYHRHPQRSVNVTTLAVPPCTWPGVSVRERRYKRSPPHCRERRSITTAALRILRERTALQLEVKYTSKKRTKARRKPRRSTHLLIPFKCGARVSRHWTVSHQLAYSNPRENGDSTGPVCTPESYRSLPQKTTVKATGLPTDSNTLCDPPAGGAAGNRNKLRKKGPSAPRQHPELRKRSGPGENKSAEVSLPLMRCSPDVQQRCRVGKPHSGSLGKERKAKRFSRISTLRGRRLRAGVLGYLCGLSAETKELIREVHGEHLLRLKHRSQKGEERRDGVGLARGTMVHDGSGPRTPAAVVAAAGGHGRASGRKRTPKACDCCGPNCRPPPPKAPAPAHGTPGRRGRRKKVPEAEPPTTRDAPPPGDDSAPLNGASDPPHGVDMEVSPPATEGAASGEVPVSEAPVLEALELEVPELEVPVLESPELDVPAVESPESEVSESCRSQRANPLLDHRYCKTEDGDSATEEEAAKNQLLTTEVNNEDLTELIHEFLEHFYGKYGSFIPLSETDVLEHLNKKLNSDLTDRKTFIFSEVTKYRAGLACAPMHYFKVAYNKHTLTLEDLSTLDDQNWVNDQVINMYGELIVEAANQKVHFFNSFFHRQLVAKGYEGVKRWTKKVDLFTKSLLLIPIHLEIHWSLITVDVTNQNIHFYDSQGIMFKYAVENILKYILAEAKDKKHTAYQKGWKMIVNKSIPQQKNDSDCGVFVLEYCKCLALKQPLQFTQEDMPKVRKRIYKELCECKLKG